MRISRRVFIYENYVRTVRAGTRERCVVSAVQEREVAEAGTTARIDYVIEDAENVANNGSPGLPQDYIARNSDKRELKQLVLWNTTNSEACITIGNCGGTAADGRYQGCAKT
jgi:hypothetical protein